MKGAETSGGRTRKEVLEQLRCEIDVGTEATCRVRWRTSVVRSGSSERPETLLPHSSLSHAAHGEP